MFKIQVVEKIERDLKFNISPTPENRADHEVVSKNMVERSEAVNDHMAELWMPDY
jgi:hypothetical protein